jgi:hypothetical protein
MVMTRLNGINLEVPHRFSPQHSPRARQNEKALQLLAKELTEI